MTQLACSPQEALKRAFGVVDLRWPYVLGSGGFNPHAQVDVPWTEGKVKDPTTGEIISVLGCDCLGLVCYANKLVRHMPGLNKGNPSGVYLYDVEDDINSNSLLGDAYGAQQLCTIVTGNDVLPGDILVYPTITLKNADGSWVKDDEGNIRKWIGHGGEIESVPEGWTRDRGFVALSVIQCHGPNMRTPAVQVTDGHAWDQHDHTWEKQYMRTHVLRFKTA